MKEKEAREIIEMKVQEITVDESIGWTRGTAKPSIASEPKREEKEKVDVFLTRNAMGIKKNEIEGKKDDDAKRPIFQK